MNTTKTDIISVCLLIISFVNAKCKELCMRWLVSLIDVNNKKL